MTSERPSLFSELPSVACVAVPIYNAPHVPIPSVPTVQVVAGSHDFI